LKIQLAAAVALAVTLAGHNAFAKTLEDILREKGVITEEDYRAVTKSRPPITSSAKVLPLPLPTRNSSYLLGPVSRAGIPLPTTKPVRTPLNSVCAG